MIVVFYKVDKYILRLLTNFFIIILAYVAIHEATHMRKLKADSQQCQLNDRISPHSTSSCKRSIVNCNIALQTERFNTDDRKIVAIYISSIPKIKSIQNAKWVKTMESRFNQFFSLKNYLGWFFFIKL